MFPLSAALALPAALSLAGCGLEQFLVVLDGPTKIDFGSPASIYGFTATNADELEFLGYEIYYKLFTSTTVPAVASYSSYDDMILAGYRRLQNPNGAASPLIVVDDEDRNELFTVTINFSPTVLPAVFPKITTSPAPAETLQPATTSLINSVRRPIEVFSVYQHFTIAELVGNDVPADVLEEISNDSTAGVALFALSFGATDDDIIVYSVPEFLGGQKIQFPLTDSDW